MNWKIVACEIFREEIRHLMEKHRLEIPAVFLEIASHNDTNRLRTLLQEEIRRTGPEVTHILLFYGLCGNGTAGLSSRDHTLVIPRAHDCCTVLLGSRSRFQECFGENLSAAWTSNMYFRKKGWDSTSDSRGQESLGLNLSLEEYTALYGEENGAFLYETLKPKESAEVIFIRIPETENREIEEEVRTLAEEHRRDFRLITGSLNLLEKALTGTWDGDFLTVPPGQSVQPSWDEDVMTGKTDE